MRLIDWHIHPYYSQDAEGSVEAFVLQALKVGLESIALTTHIDLNPARDVIDNWMRVNGKLVRISDDAVKHYIADVKDAQTKYLNEIEILLGFEFSYGRNFEDRIARFVEKYKPDVAIGSAHSLGNIGFTASKEVYFYKNTAPSGFLAEYCQKIADLVRSGLFSIVGHLDGYRKYLGAQWDGQLDDAEQRFFPPVFDEMAKRRVGVEVELVEWTPSTSTSEALLPRWLAAATERFKGKGSGRSSKQEYNLDPIDEEDEDEGDGKPETPARRGLQEKKVIGSEP